MMMLSRRYLRRTFVPILFIPAVLIGIILFFYNLSSSSHDELPQQHDDHHHHHHHQQQQQDSQTTGQNSIKQKHLDKESMMKSVLPNHQRDVAVPIGINPVLSPFKPIQLIASSNQKPTLLPVIETKSLERFVHLDLKGAAPKIDYYKTLFPYLKQLGATGLLIEYEDMFPFTGNLAIVKHGFAYSATDIGQIIDLAEKNGLKLMPLLQVYGHLEYVLKLKEFQHLREDYRYPQVITPCLEESYTLIFAMIDQMLALHPSIPFLHIGCDEVYYRLIHPQCSKQNFRDDADLFIRHVTRVAKYVKSKRPSIKLFIWHDMLSQLAYEGTNNISELIQLVVPMIWAYVDDIKTWLDDAFWRRFAIFPEIWVASSYKGSSGEITTMTYIGHHQRNQQTWLEAMYTASRNYAINFTGIAITGWSRYDHMLSLCELIPSSIPSLAYVLQTIEHGHITDQLNYTIGQSLLGCRKMPLWERTVESIFVSCTFPGHQLYEVMYTYENVMRLYDETMSFVRLYVTDIHIKQNYIHFKRSQECFERLVHLENQMIYFIDVFQNSCLLFFTPDVPIEWLQTYFMRLFHEVQEKTNFIEHNLKVQSAWSPRPLPNDTMRIVVKKRNFTYMDVNSSH